LLKILRFNSPEIRLKLLENVEQISTILYF
jgi:hypothetical protein